MLRNLFQILATPSILLRFKSLLGIQIDIDLTFDEHISSMCNKVGKEINVLRRLSNCMLFDEHHMVMKGFIESQCNYYL